MPFRVRITLGVAEPVVTGRRHANTVRRVAVGRVFPG